MATTACYIDDYGALAVATSHGPPPEGGLWYLVRGVNCGGNGTYDEGVARRRPERRAVAGMNCQLPAERIGFIASGRGCMRDSVTGERLSPTP